MTASIKIGEKVYSRIDQEPWTVSKIDYTACPPTVTLTRTNQEKTIQVDSVLGGYYVIVGSDRDIVWRSHCSRHGWAVYQEK